MSAAPFLTYGFFIFGCASSSVDRAPIFSNLSNLCKPHVKVKIKFTEHCSVLDCFLSEYDICDPGPQNQS